MDIDLDALEALTEKARQMGSLHAIGAGRWDPDLWSEYQRATTIPHIFALIALARQAPNPRSRSQEQEREE